MTAVKGKAAIVTNAASGFGAQVARRYVKQGAKVMIADLNLAAGEKVAAKLGSNAIAAQCDVTKASDVLDTVRRCVQAFSVPDIDVNNVVRTNKDQPMLNVDDETLERVYVVLNRRGGGGSDL